MTKLGFTIVLFHFMDINNTQKKIVWVLVGTKFHIRFKMHDTENRMQKVNNFIFHNVT